MECQLTLNCYGRLIKEALVATHCKLCLEISEGLKCYADNDDKRSAAEGERAGKRLRLTCEGGGIARKSCRVTARNTLQNPLDKRSYEVRSCNRGNNRNDCEEECARKSNLVEYLSDIFSGGSALSDTADCTVST